MTVPRAQVPDDDRRWQAVAAAGTTPLAVELRDGGRALLDSVAR